jgi:hypothetical protein
VGLEKNRAIDRKSVHARAAFIEAGGEALLGAGSAFSR